MKILKNFRKALSDFEKYIKDIYSKNISVETENQGYLINLEDYEKIKEIIDNYEVNINDCGKIFQIKQIEFKTPQYLIYMILNENKYIFINNELWRLICDKELINESPITYKVNNNDITFNLDKIELSFNHNENIIDKTSLISSSNYKSDFEKITKVYDSIICYDKFENKILKALKNKKYIDDKSNGFLLSNEWINKWKKITNYENIKSDYLQNNLSIKKNIMNILIYHLEQNKYDLNKLFDSISVKKLDKKKDLKSYLRNESLVLVDNEFIDIFYNSFMSYFKSIKYNVFNSKINIYLDDDEILSFKSNDNIISLNGIINYSNLIQLIKIFYIQKEIKSNIKDAHNNIYLINKKVIIIYKNIFNYQKLYDFLKSNQKTNKIDYDNLKKYYYKIINYLDDEYLAQFVHFEKNTILNKFKDINENFNELEYKINSPSKKILKYIINFEIIDKDIKDFFIRNNIAKEEHFISLYSYKSENGKILIIFDKDNNSYYELGHFNDNEDFILEYLIEELENVNKDNIADYFSEKGIDSFINDSKEKQNTINLKSWWTDKKFFYYKIDLKEIPKVIKSFQTPDGNDNNNNNVELVHNSFNEIIKDKNLFEVCLNNNFNYENKFYYKSYLINNKNIKEPNKNGNIELDINNNNKVNKYISYLIIIHNEYSRIKKEINETVIKQSNIQQKEEEYYLVNRKYMEELENILHFKEIINEVNINKIENLDLDINNVNNEIINEIKGELKGEIINYLITLNEKLVINNEYEISTIEVLDNEKNGLHYFNKCQIVNKKLYLLLIQIDKNLSTKIKHIRCILNNKKIIILYNDKIINTGYLNEDNAFIIEHIIYSVSSDNILQIFEIFKTKGYIFMQTYLLTKKIKTIINDNLIEAINILYQRKKKQEKI